MEKLTPVEWLVTQLHSNKMLHIPSSLVDRFNSTLKIAYMRERNSLEHFYYSGTEIKELTFEEYYNKTYENTNRESN